MSTIRVTPGSLPRHTVDTRPRWRRRLAGFRRRPETAVRWLVGDRTFGNGSSAPLEWFTARIGPKHQGRELVIGTDGGGEVDLTLIYREVGTSEGLPHEFVDEIRFHGLTRRESDFLALTIIRMRLLDLFGLRTRLYFWALRRELRRVR